MASSAVNIDSQRGGQWCDAVEQINNKVQQVMSEVAQIIEDMRQHRRKARESSSRLCAEVYRDGQAVCCGRENNSRTNRKSGPVRRKGHRRYFDCGENCGSICLILIWCGLKAKGAHYYGNEF